MPMKLMIIDWIDTSSDGDAWDSIKALAKRKLALCRSVGWLINETVAHIHLVPNISHCVTEEDEDDDQEGFGGITIIKQNIYRMQEVEEAMEEDECD